LRHDLKEYGIKLSSLEVTCISTVFKRFFSEMTRPIFLESNYGLLIEAVDFDSHDDMIRNILSTLPEFNFMVVKILFNFLHEVSTHADENLMNPINIAIVFGPSLLRPDEKEYTSILFDSPQITKVVATMIEKYHFFFESTPITEIDFSFHEALRKKYTIRIQNNIRILETVRKRRNVVDIDFDSRIGNFSRGLIDGVFNDIVSEYSSEKKGLLEELLDSFLSDTNSTHTQDAESDSIEPSRPIELDTLNSPARDE